MPRDATPFESLFRAEYARLVRASERLCGERALAEDVVQGVFARYYERVDRAGVEQPAAYLRRAVVTRTINAIRDRKRLDLPGEEGLWSAAEQTNDAPATDLAEVHERIRAAVEALPTRARLILRLSRFEGLSHKEIASELGIAPKTVENQLARALLLLRKRLTTVGIAVGIFKALSC